MAKVQIKSHRFTKGENQMLTRESIIEGAMLTKIIRVMIDNYLESLER